MDWRKTGEWRNLFSDEDLEALAEKIGAGWI